MKGALPTRVRFGAFEFDLKTGELVAPATECRTESRIVLSDQLFCLLVMVVKREGEIVTREEIQKKFWPNDTIVEFDHSINVAVGKLRKALGDCAAEPKYIETLARHRGYRLMVPVERVEAAAESSSSELSQLHGASPPTEMKLDSAGLILQSDLSGKFKVLTEVPNSREWVAHAFPSRDGRHLMYTQWNLSESVVMLENF